MSLSRETIEELIFGTQRLRRFTQDSPVLPDVWLAYNDQPGDRVDLLLTPYRHRSAAELYRQLRERLRRDAGKKPAPDPWEMTYNESYVVARLSLAELVRSALPLTKWWAQYVWSGFGRDSEDPGAAIGEAIAALQKAAGRAELAALIERRREGTAPRRLPAASGEVGEPRAEPGPVSSDLLWMIEIVGAMALEADRVGRGRAKGRRSPPRAATARAGLDAVIASFERLVRGMPLAGRPPAPLLWSVHRNRRARQAIWKSSLAVKADAARRLFQVDCKGLRWAVIDSGIDATHPAFRRRQGEGPGAKPYPHWLGAANENHTRVVESYDFTRLRSILNPEKPVAEMGRGGRGLRFSAEDRRRVKEIRTSIQEGGMLDWERLAKLLRRPLDQAAGESVPTNPHGTHVAGILAGDWRIADGIPDRHELQGMCPDLELIDLRVFDDAGESDEFTIVAALQFVRYLNQNRAQPAVHGVNLSLSLLHNVMNYACGRTPVCEECQRLVNVGTVVVAAAGNEGHTEFQTTKGPSEGYRSISITDPGNADGVITVGATHRDRAFTYGVSYFSSRGPTGDGRAKPDLVAPGEKITSAVPGEGLDSLDGTSMAAPHVSGAAAMLMARHEELVGDPARIKKILCTTATDLGRERFFQGHGMLDVLRALQSV